MTTITEIKSSNTRVLVATLLIELSDEQELEQEAVDAALNAAKKSLASEYSVYGNTTIVAFPRVRFNDGQTAKLNVDCNVVIEDESVEEADE